MITFRRWRALRLVPLTSLLLLASVSCSRQSGADALPVLPKGGDFTLTDHHAQPFTLSSLHGKVVLVFFGYSFCPDVCPTTLSKLTVVARKLGEQQQQLKTLYISVDPDRDTPSVLADDLASFKLDAIGLTGAKADIDRVVKLFGASYEIVPTPESVAKYTVSHSTSLYVLDKQGRMRAELPYEATIDDVVKTVKSLLAE